MKKLILIAFGAFDLWILASWINVWMNNARPDGMRAVWNIFEMLF